MACSYKEFTLLTKVEIYIHTTVIQGQIFKHSYRCTNILMENLGNEEDPSYHFMLSSSSALNRHYNSLLQLLKTHAILASL